MQQKIQELQPWFHNLHLPGGLQTKADHPLGDFPRFKWEQFQAYIPEDLTGWTALDIGCNAGFYTFELAKRGASVAAIDVNHHYLTQAKWAADLLGLSEQITFKKMQVYDLVHQAETYDLVLFMGVFYHLRYPLLALDIIAQKVQQKMVFQALTLPGDEAEIHVPDFKMTERDKMLEPGWPRMAFVENAFCGDLSNWWIPNKPAIYAMLRSAGLIVSDDAGSEIYICRRNLDTPSCITTWNRNEHLAATGQNHD